MGEIIQRLSLQACSYCLVLSNPYRLQPASTNASSWAPTMTFNSQLGHASTFWDDLSHPKTFRCLLRPCSSLLPARRKSNSFLRYLRITLVCDLTAFDRTCLTAGDISPRGPRSEAPDRCCQPGSQTQNSRTLDVHNYAMRQEEAENKSWFFSYATSLRVVHLCPNLCLHVPC